MKRSCHHLCPSFQAAMDVLARPWTGFIIATLEQGPLRFGELGERIATIGDRMLSARLKELEAHGLVVRRVLAGPPVRVEYELTHVGRGFRDVAQVISRWGAMLRKARLARPEPKRAAASARSKERAVPRRARRASSTRRQRSA